MVSVLSGGVPVSQAVPCVPALSYSPSGCFQKGCRACLCLLGLSWLQASCAIFVGGFQASSLWPGAQHLRACPRDRLLPLPGTPSPARLCQKGAAPGGGRAQVSDLEQKGKIALFRCGPASPSHCLALRWFRSHVGRSGVGPQFSRTTVLSRCLVQTPDCGFVNSFLGAIRGGTVGCSSLTSWRVRGAGWFCLWALDLVEV
ncbi:hypothetical protein Taro_041521 [Colocasia esculenta]|uniref:Uncharacterized protein n=1 Tax=Colocasia esculenta TaxID=4460 RepID=A0A843WXI1_COLES|nr:hypothetical protein [Colocasia esculenta]